MTINKLKLTSNLARNLVTGLVVSIKKTTICPVATGTVFFPLRGFCRLKCFYVNMYIYIILYNIHIIKLDLKSVYTIMINDLCTNVTFFSSGQTPTRPHLVNFFSIPAMPSRLKTVTKLGMQQIVGSVTNHTPINYITPLFKVLFFA